MGGRVDNGWTGGACMDGWVDSAMKPRHLP